MNNWNDGAIIKKQLLANIDRLLKYLLPKGVFTGNSFVVGNIGGDEGKSLVVTVAGDKAGLWYDFATGQGGDLFSLWALVHKLDVKNDFSKILNDIARWLGLSNKLGICTGKWSYYSADGKLLASVFRYDSESGKQYRPWDEVLKCYKLPDPRPLYNQTGIVNSNQVILVEGEKSAQSLIDIGICATTAMNGAKAPIHKTDWSPLVGKHVIIWPDKDKPGLEYAENIRRHLMSINISFSVLSPPDNKPDKWDAFDAVNEGMDIQAFLQTANFCVRSEGKFNISNWTAEQYGGRAPKRRFLVEGIIPIGKTILFSAMGDTGKGLLTLNLALKVAIGKGGIAFGNDIKEFGTAVILTAEDDRDEIHIRLEHLDPERERLIKSHKLIIVPLPNAGGSFPFIYESKGSLKLSSYFEELSKQLQQIDDLKLVVFDPLSAFISSDINTNHAVISFVMAKLSELASKTQASFLVVHHLRKSSNEIKTVFEARDSIRGTSALVDGVRGAYVMWPVPSHEQHVIFKLLNKPFTSNSLYRGAIVKANFPADRTLHTYLRDEVSGLLVNITDQIKPDSKSSDSLETLKNIIAAAARDGEPFTHTGVAGVFRNRHRLPEPINLIGRDRLEGYVQELLNSGKIIKGCALNSQEKKWLDIPDGMFGKSVGILINKGRK